MATPVEAAKRSKVTILYNGQPATVEYQPRQALQALLARALNTFGIVTNRDDMALYNAAGDELDLSQSVEEAGVQPDDELVLRQRIVRGGRR